MREYCYCPYVFTSIGFHFWSYLAQLLNFYLHSGRPHVIPALDFDLDDARLTYDTNVFGPMLMVQAFIRLLIPARGLVINISSGSTEIPYLFGGVYSASKAAINQYSRVLRLELKPFNVRVMCCMTGTVKSNIASRPAHDLPGNSLYKPVNDMYQRRLTWSQRTGTMSAEEFAVGLVTEALKGEGWLGHLIGGTRDWFWHGGRIGAAWFTGFLPRWLVEGFFALYFGIPEMKTKIRSANLKKD